MSHRSRGRLTDVFAWCFAIVILAACVSRADQLAFTLTYDGPVFTNGASVPNPYPGIAAATVTHVSTDQNEVPFEAVSFWNGVSPGNGYGNLTNVAVGPRGTPSQNGLTDPAWGVINILPNYPGTFVRLISCDLASLDDNNVDETGVGIHVHEEFPWDYFFWTEFVTAAGDVNNTTHTHVVFTNASGAPVESPVDVGLSLWWEARGGRVAVDNVKFEVVGPIPPVLARNDSYSVFQGGSFPISDPGVLANDLLREATGPLSAGLVYGPEHGTLNLSTNGGFSYTPVTNFTGMDGFIYRAADQVTNSSAGVALISVLPPNALFNDDFARPIGGAALTPWQVARTLTATGAVSFGEWSVTNGLLTGTSPLNSPGHLFVSNNWSDCSIEVRASIPADGFGWNLSGRVDPATGRRYSVGVIPIGTSGAWVLRLIKYTGWNSWSGATLNYQLDVPVPGAGTTNLHSLKLTLHGNHLLVHWDGVLKMNVFDNGFEGPVLAGGGVAVGMYTLTNTYTLNVEDVIVQGLNPPIATDLTVVTPEDTATNLVLQGSSPEGPVTFAIARAPTNGVLTGLNANTGELTYTPATDYHGVDAFVYTVSDGTLLATGLVSLVVMPVDDPPFATSFDVEVPEDTAANLMMLGGDLDGPVTFAILAVPTNGALSALNPDTGAVTYLPATNFNGLEAFTFLVSEAGLTATGLVSITVMPVNDAPLALNFGVTALEEVATNLTLLGSDVEGPVTFSILVGPTNGLLSNLDTTAGTVRYLPSTNFFGSDGFTFLVSDDVLQATGAVSVTVVPVNDLPLAPGLIIEVLEETAVSLQLTGSDVEGPVRFAIAGGPEIGILSNLNTNTGSVTYTAASGYEGPDPLTYTVSDGALSATGLVKVTVLPKATGFHAGVEVAGNLALLPDRARDLAAYFLGAGTNVTRSWTHIDAGSARRVVVRGRYAFVAGGPEGLITIDLTDTERAIAEGHFQTEGTCADVAVSGETAFITDWERGVVALDVSSPAYPLEISTLASNQTVLSLEAIGNLLYLAAGPAGLLIYDLSDPLDPQFLAALPMTGSASRVRVLAGLACLITGGGTRLEVVSVTNAQSPVLLGTYQTSGQVSDLDLSGLHVFLANTNGNLEVVSLADTANPALVATQSVTGGAVGVRVVGNVAYVRDLSGNLVAVDLAGFDPLPPSFLSPVQDVISILGKEVVFAADTEGSAPLVYQWFRNGVPLTDNGRISGTTNAFLKLGDVRESDGGAYSVLVTNAFGQMMSSNALLTLVLPGTPVEQGSIELGGFTAGVWTDGRHAYTAAGILGLRAFDVSNPHFPVAAGSFDTEGNAVAVEVIGRHAFVADGAAGIRIIDLINSPILSPIGSFDTPGTAWGVNVIAGMAFVADGESGLRIIDVTEPRQPTALGAYDTLGTAYSVRVNGGLAYVADGSAGVQIINVTNPANPSWIGTFDTDGNAYRVEVIGNRAYVADGTNGLVILDVSNPASPVRLGHYLTAGPLMALVAVDSIALLAEGTAGLEVVNTSDPTNVLRIGLAGAMGDVRDVKLVGNTVAVACGTNGVRMLSLFGIAPAPPVVVSALGDQYLLPGQDAVLPMTATGTNPLRYQWFKEGRMLFERVGVHGVISDTLQLTNLTFADTGEYSLTVWNAWNLAAGASVNLYVVPLGTPVPRANYDNRTDLLAVQISGQRGFGASRLGGLEIVDFRDLHNPVSLGTHPTMSFAQQVQLRGHLAYIAAWESGLEIFDVSVPTNVVRIGHCDTPGLALGVQVAGQLAYVADQTNGLQIVDVRIPGQPFLLSTSRTLGPALRVQVKAGKAFVACSGAGLDIFDVSDPLGPFRLGWIDTPGEAENVEIVGNYAYVSDYDQGLQVIDVSNPSAPMSLGSYRARGDVFQVQVVSNLAYVAKGVAGLDVVNTSNPLLPLLALPGKAGTTVHGIQVSGKHAYLADRTSGFVIAELLGVPAVAPELVESPASTEAPAGGTLVLSVAVSGTPPFDYQWFKDDAALNPSDTIQGVSEPHLRLNNLTASDAGEYFVVVSNHQGVVTSAAATVIVSSPAPPLIAPSVTTQPISTISSPGGAVAFQATASGSAPLLYRWTHNGQPVFDGPHFSGATTNRLVVSSIGLLQDGSYQLKVWNGAGLATSLPATLTFVGPLQEQINNAAAGTNLILAPGVYEEKLVITRHVTISGAGPGITTLDALGQGTVMTIGEGANVTLNGLTIRNGRSPANGMGGGISNHGQLQLQDCELVNNAADRGGGLYNAGSFYVTNTTLTGNRAVGLFDTGPGIGGGLYSAAGTGWFVNCTISSNSAPAAGAVAGGVFVGGGVLEFRSTTLAFNSAATTAGGVLADSNSLVRARNTLFAGNWQGTRASDFNGALESAGYNFLQAAAEAVIIGGDSTDLLGLDPLLGALQDNGGSTRTHALRSGSPAIDAGACDGLSADQRGVARPFDVPPAPNAAGGCDIGAFEYHNAPPVFLLPPDLVMNEDTTFVVPLVRDAETPASLSFTAASDNEALVPSANLLIQRTATNWVLRLAPLTNAFGSVLLFFSVADADGATNSTVVELIVQPVNDPPVATNLAVNAIEDTALNLSLLGSDLEGPVTFGIGVGPAHGMLSNLDANAGTLTYTPATNFSGADTFRFVVSDGDLFATGLVSIAVSLVNDPPVAYSLTVVTPEDVFTNLVLRGTDVEGPVSLEILTQPAHGVLSELDPESWLVTYRPLTNFNGADGFSFVVSDGLLQATGAVSIAILPVNDPPVISGVSNQVVDPAATQYSIPFTVTDVDHAIETVTVEADSSNSAVIDPAQITVSGGGTNRLVLLQHVPGAVGATTLRLIASDLLSTSTNQFLLEVKQVQLSLVGLTVEDKEYDGETTATIVSYGTLDGVLPGHDVSLDVSGATTTFDDARAGVSRTVTVSGLSLSGPSASSYSISNQTSTASILPRNLVVSASGMNKVYDGTVSAAVSLSDNRLAGDVLNTTYAAASFANQQAGTGKLVTVSGIGVSGPDAGNYAANNGAATSASILPRSLVASATGVNKVYDGTVNATVSMSDDRVAGDVVSVSHAGARFADKTVGTAKPVTVSGLAVSGPDAGNYVLSAATATDTADITAKSVTPGIVANDKVYDGTTSASLSSQSVTGVIVSDVVTLGVGAANFDTKNVGVGKTVTASGLSLGGADAGNYIVNSNAVTSASILPRNLAVSAVGVNKIYDGLVRATVTLSHSVIAGDVFTVTNAGATFADKHVGSGKVVTVTGIGVTGLDAGNYTVNTTAVTSASILLRNLVVSATGMNKVYDGTVKATVNLQDNRVAGDALSLSHVAANFADKLVGLNKPVAVSGIVIAGPDAGNYNLSNTSTNTTANITKAPLTARADNQTRVYSQPNPILTVSYSGFVSGEGLNDLDSLPTPSTTATSASLPGDYPIVLTGGVDDSYAFVLVNGTLTVVDAPLYITSLVVSNGVAVINWSATPGRTYRLQYREEVNEENWIDVPPDIVADGPSTAATNLLGDSQHRFYRVMRVQTAAATPPVITSIAVSEGMAVIQWTATAGQTYRLQHKEDLTAQNWTDAGPDILATGTTARATNLLGGGSHRYYRVKVFPQR